MKIKESKEEFEINNESITIDNEDNASLKMKQDDLDPTSYEIPNEELGKEIFDDSEEANVELDDFEERKLENQYEREQLEYVIERGYRIKCFKCPSELVQLAAVKQYENSIKYIKKNLKISEMISK